MIRALLSRIFAALAVLLGVGNAQANPPYTDSRYLTAVPFGAHSPYLLPWRSYEETIPAARFLDGIGMNINIGDGVNPDLIHQMLAKHGIRQGRYEVGWGSMRWDADDLEENAKRHWTPILQSAKKYGIRPLILLNSHHGVPCPTRFFDRILAAPAKKGDRTIRLTDTKDLVIGKSGVNGLTDYWAAEALITKIEGDAVTLSKPLPKDLGAAGAKISMATLKYRPFGPPETPEYKETLDGWTRYARAVAKFAAQTLGTTGKPDLGFDMEIWNELSFGSNFTVINQYYQPKAFEYREDLVWGAIVTATADAAEAHPADFAGVIFCDGFANTIPWPSAGSEPPRVAAMSKHPYPGRHTYPKDKGRGPIINALFKEEPNTAFYPSFSVNFPEYFATYLQTESVMRDLAPLTTDIYGGKHGRTARILNGKIVPVELWFTENGFAPNENGITDREAALALKARTTSRFYCFCLGKGMERLYLFAALEKDLWLGLVNENFVEYAKKNATYPADDSAFVSPALRTMARIVAHIEQDKKDLDPKLTATRKITVASITDTHNNFQFKGDATPEHPTLYDRDTLAILPLQVNARRFVIPYYVVTYDVQKPLTPEKFTVHLNGLKGATATVSAYDPINDKPVLVTIKQRGADFLALEVLAADYPYLLTVQEKP